MSVPSLTDPKIWEHRRAHYFRVLERALMLLRERDNLPEEERELNRALRFTVTTACYENDPDGRFGYPVFEAQNLADPEVDETQPYEFKIPDAQWRHYDPAASDDRHREKSFTVECKRLGSPSKARFNFNEEYVVSGILRFKSRDHRYGAQMTEGAMIGYVQSMGLEAVHKEVCNHVKTHRTPALVLLPPGWQPRKITQLAHQLGRSFPVSPFRLTHLWLDIQDVPIRSCAPKPRKAHKKARAGKRKRPSAS